MKHSIKSIEKKIVSVGKISKITKAMKVIATMNFQKIVNKISNFSLRESIINEIFTTLQYLIEYEKIPQKNSLQVKKQNTVWLIFTSDLGLCGSYNTSIYNKVTTQIKKTDYLILVGKKGINYFHYLGWKPFKKYLSSDFIEQGIDEVINWIMKNFLSSFAFVKIVHTEFSASLNSQKVHIKQLFPIEKNLAIKPKEVIAFFVVELSPWEVYQKTIDIYLHSLIFLYYWSSRASEEKIRQIAMENASDNAQEMVENLRLQYNQIRQEKITREILLVSRDD